MQKQKDVNRIQTLIFVQRLCTFLLILKYLNWIKKVIDENSSTIYTYDPLYRLTQATGPWGSIQYNYDPVGNRTVETAGAGITNYTYDANKLISSSGAKAFTFSYDNNGNTVSENQRQYIYNQNQRLIRASETDTVTGTVTVLGEYLYNGNGQRVKKTANGKTIYYIYDQSGNLIEEADESGQVNADYIYLGSIPIARVDEWWEGIQTPQAPTGVTVTPGDRQLTVSWNANQEPVDGYKVYWGTESRNYTNTADAGKTTSYTITELTNGTTYYIAVKAYVDLKETYYYHTDHLGTPIIMTDKNQNVVWNGEFLPFGEPLSITGTIKNNLRFPGQYFDEETGLHYNWHRDYKPDIGRYVEVDTIGLRGGINRFSYAGNNPTNFFDPMGFRVELCSAPVDVWWVPDFIEHAWLKTSSKEAGMGLVGCGSLVGSPIGKQTAICPPGRSGNCKEVSSCVDATCVNNELITGKPLGPWGPLNNCWSFVGEVINKCAKKDKCCGKK